VILLLKASPVSRLGSWPCMYRIIIPEFDLSVRIPPQDKVLWTDGYGRIARV
jgi:hypothetical protein